MAQTCSLGILVSGRGSNLQVIIDAIQGKQLHATIGVVIANKNDAYAIERAQKAGIPTAIIEHKQFENKQAFEQALIECLHTHNVKMVVLAGFMRILSKHFLDHFPKRVINIHPSLLPAFPGLHPQLQALEAGAKVAGCTVHYVDETVDGGPIIAQAQVPVLENDTEASLSARILEQEHILYSQSIQHLIESMQ